MSNTQLIVETHISTQTTLHHMAFCIMTNVTISAYILLTENHVTIRQFPPIWRNNKEHIMYLEVIQPVQKRSSTRLALLNRSGYHGICTKMS